MPFFSRWHAAPTPLLMPVFCLRASGKALTAGEHSLRKAVAWQVMGMHVFIRQVLSRCATHADCKCRFRCSEAPGIPGLRCDIAGRVAQPGRPVCRLAHAAGALCGGGCEGILVRSQLQFPRPHLKCYCEVRVCIAIESATADLQQRNC